MLRIEAERRAVSGAQPPERDAAAATHLEHLVADRHARDRRGPRGRVETDLRVARASIERDHRLGRGDADAGRVPARAERRLPGVARGPPVEKSVLVSCTATLSAPYSAVGLEHLAERRPHRTGGLGLADGRKSRRHRTRGQTARPRISQVRVPVGGELAGRGGRGRASLFATWSPAHSAPPSSSLGNWASVAYECEFELELEAMDDLVRHVVIGRSGSELCQAIGNTWIRHETPGPSRLAQLPFLSTGVAAAWLPGPSGSGAVISLIEGSAGGRRERRRRGARPSSAAAVSPALAATSSAAWARATRSARGRLRVRRPASSLRNAARCAGVIVGRYAAAHRSGPESGRERPCGRRRPAALYARQRPDRLDERLERVHPGDAPGADDHRLVPARLAQAPARAGRPAAVLGRLAAGRVGTGRQRRQCDDQHHHDAQDRPHGRGSY